MRLCWCWAGGRGRLLTGSVSRATEGVQGSLGGRQRLEARQGGALVPLPSAELGPVVCRAQRVKGTEAISFQSQQGRKDREQTRRGRGGHLNSVQFSNFQKGFGYLFCKSYRERELLSTGLLTGWLHWAR